MAKQHTLCDTTVLALSGRKNGASLRSLARQLGYPETFAATLSQVLREMPGALSAAGERELRKRLGLTATGRAYRDLFDMPVKELASAIRERVPFS